MTKKRIVLVTNWVYPVNSIASNRINAFVKYLSKEKFEIIVVSRLDEGLLPLSTFSDSTIYRESGSHLFRLRRQKNSDKRLIHNLKSINNVLLRKFLLQDFPYWAKNVTKKLNQLHFEKNIDLIISSFSPLDTHIAAYSFIKKNPNVKWIADMRDEISKNPSLSKKAKEKLEQFEKKIAPYVSALTSVSHPILNDFRSIFNKVPLLEIRNGFDHNVAPINKSNAIFTIIYAGSLYGARKPTTFFEGLKLLQKQKKLPNNFKIKFLGTTHNFTIPKTLKEHCEFLPMCDYEEAITIIRSADTLLLIHPNNGMKGVYSGKIFDYLSVEKPILAVVDKEDVAADLIRYHNAGFVADFDDIDEIGKNFLNCYQLWNSKINLEIKNNPRKTLHRKFQVQKLEKLICELLEKTKNE